MHRQKRFQFAAMLWVLVVTGMLAASAFPSYVENVDPAFRDLGCQGCHAAGTPNSVVLKAAQISPAAAPSIDGVEDAVWATAQFIRANVSGGFNPVSLPGEDGWSANGAPLPWATANSTTVTMKALFDAENVYMLFSWRDPTYSAQRQPWAFNGTSGQWVQLGAIPYYEDKFSVLWEIGEVTGFRQGGCLVTCHATTANRTAPLKYAPEAGQFIDMWHWKMVRQNAVDQVDDQYVDYDTTASSAGRKSDPSDNASRGYKDNRQTLHNGTANLSVPAYWIPGRDNYWWILLSEIESDVAKHIVSVDASNTLHDEDGTAIPAAATIPGIYTSAYTGDRGDILGRGGWANDEWTLEVKRALTTSHRNPATNQTELSKYDVQFTDSTKSYHFGIAVFDNTQIGHMWHPGPYRLQFGESPRAAPSNLDTWGFSVAAAASMVSGLGALTLAYAARARGAKAGPQLHASESESKKGGGS